MDDFTHDHDCRTEDVAAYLDSELDGAAAESFEAHLKTCARCATELRMQRQLLCTLDFAFSEPSFELPGNFSRVVAAHAESDLSGMRKKSERRRAVQLCALLALLAFALLGAAVIVRVVGRALIVAPHGLGLILVLPFVIALALLPRLIVNYHRAHVIE